MPSQKDKSVRTANAYSQGDIANLDDAMTRRLIASVVLTESNGGDLDITNSLGYVGRYQAGAGWLADAGFVDSDKLRATMAKDGFTREAAWGAKGRMTKFLSDPSNWKNGLSLDRYKASAELQDRAFKTISDKAYKQALREGVLSETDDTAKVAGYLKARHISGSVGARKALDGIAVSDDYRTSNIKYLEDITRDGDGLSQWMIHNQKPHSQAQAQTSLTAFEINNVLRLGAHGPDVGNLQTHLRNLGYADFGGHPLEPDGQFGNNTYYAVEAFQRDIGLKVDGIAGPNTLAALREATRTQSITTSPQMAPPPDLDAIAIRTLQQQLNMLGTTDHRNQALPLTGTYDDATRSAVKGFQQGQGLPATGLADPATRALIEARATIAALQQNATHTAPVHETSLLEAPMRTSGAPSVTRQNQPSPPRDMPPLQRVAPASHFTHSVVSPSATSLEPVASRSHQDALPDQNPLAAIQAQLHDMQRQMEAMHRQREQEREKERVQESSRATPNEPARHNAHEAHRHETSTPHAVEPLSYSDRNHPQHALYARLKELLPPGTTEERLEQSTAACHMGRITRPEQLHQIHIHDDAVHFLTTRPDAYARINLDQPAPTVQQTMQHVQMHHQQQAQMSAQWEMQQREVNARGGPTLHGPALH